MRPLIYFPIVMLVAAGCQTTPAPGILARLPEPALVDREKPAPATPPIPETPVAVDASPGGRGLIPPAWTPTAALSPRWTAIVIHHTASDTGSLRDIDQWHKANGWDGCGYHFVIGNGTHSGDGQIEVGPRWINQSTGAHTRLYGSTSSPEGNYYNEHGIGIVLVGNMDQAEPTPRQLESLVKLVGCLSGACHIPLRHVYCHGELKCTDCPGQYFPKAEVRRRLMDALAQLNVTDGSAGG